MQYIEALPSHDMLPAFRVLCPSTARLVRCDYRINSFFLQGKEFIKLIKRCFHFLSPMNDNTFAILSIFHVYN